MASRMELYYGETGAAKSSGVAAVIAKVFQDTGKSFRVYVGDGSAATYRDWGLVDVGAVHVMDYTIHDWPLTVCQNICRGMWPVDPDNPNSKFRPLTQEELATTAGWVIEGTSVMAAYIMGHRKGGLAEQAGRGVKIGQDSPIQIKDLDTTDTGAYKPGAGPGTAFGGNPIAHYSFAQRQMLTRIEESKQLPGLVFWTGHERAGEDSNTGEKVIGPEVAGKALSAGLPRYFNNTLHFTVASKKGTGNDSHTGKNVGHVLNEYRVYTRDHFDPDGITAVKYKAVVRTPRPDLIPDYFVSNHPGDHVLKFYEALAAAKEAAIKDLEASRKVG